MEILQKGWACYFQTQLNEKSSATVYHFGMRNDGFKRKYASNYAPKNMLSNKSNRIGLDDKFSWKCLRAIQMNMNQVYTLQVPFAETERQFHLSMNEQVWHSLHAV